MVWWDERKELQYWPAAPDVASQCAGAALEAADAAGIAALHADSPTPELRQLTATVDLDCDYVRQLVVASLSRRPEWHMTVLDGQDDVVHPDAQHSDFHWAEYERIDWERVYSGGTFIGCNGLLSCVSTTTQLAELQPAKYALKLQFEHRQHTMCRACCAGNQATSSYCVRKGLIRKAHLAHNLKKWAAKHPDSRLAAATPETHILAVDDVDYIDEALSDLPEVTRQLALRRLQQPHSIGWLASF